MAAARAAERGHQPPEVLVLRARIAVTYSLPSTRRSQRFFWRFMDEAPDAHRELLDVEVHLCALGGLSGE
jgi:hypothetical protein